MQVPSSHLKSSLIPDYPLEFSAYEKRCQKQALEFSQRREAIKASVNPPSAEPVRISSEFQFKCENAQVRKMLILSELERSRRQRDSEQLLNPPDFYKVQLLKQQRRQSLSKSLLLPRYFLDLEQKSGVTSSASVYDRLAQPRTGLSDFTVAPARDLDSIPRHEQQQLNCERMHAFAERRRFVREELARQAGRQACDLDPDIDERENALRDAMASRAESRGLACRLTVGAATTTASTTTTANATTDLTFHPQITDVARALMDGQPAFLQRYDAELTQMRDNRRIAQQRAADAENSPNQNLAARSQKGESAVQRREQIMQFHERQKALWARKMAHAEQQAEQERARIVAEEEEINELKAYNAQQTAERRARGSAVGAQSPRSYEKHVARTLRANAEHERVLRLTELRE